MSPPSSVPDSDPQEDCTIPEDVLTELDTLEKSFIDLTENIESETAASVENGKVTVKSLVSRVQKEKAFQIKDIESVTSTRDFFQAILPFYTFLNCHLIIRIALFLSGPIAEEANDYDSKIIRFRKSTKVKFLQRILTRCHIQFRATSRKVVIAAEGLWGMQSIFLIEELIKMLFPMRYPDELQWFKVVSGSVIMTFIISERMILPFIEKSKKKLEFMRLMGIISLRIGDEFVIMNQENKMFSFENSLIEATMADNIEAVEFLLQYIQVDVNIKNTNRSLLNSLNHEDVPFKETIVESSLAHHHMYFIAIMKDIEHELNDLMNEFEITNSVEQLQSVQAMDKLANVILSRDNFFSDKLLATSKSLQLSDSLKRRINKHNDSIDYTKRRSLIKHLQKPLMEYYHNPFPDTVKITIILPSVWSGCSIWLVEQLVQLIVSPVHFIEFQWFRVIDTVESLRVIFLVPAHLVMDLIEESMKNMESARLLGIMKIEIDDMTVLQYDNCNMEYNFENGIDQARMVTNDQVIDILARADQLPVDVGIPTSSEDDNNNHHFILHHDSTPLMIACCNDNSQLVKLLLQYNADPNIENNGAITALMYSSGNSKIFKMLLDHGADIYATDHLKYTTLHYACMIGNVPVIETILKRNRDMINMTNNYRYTPLIMACYNKQLSVVKRLLKEHADPNIPDMSGCTPLLHASIYGYLPIVEELLHNHANPNSQYVDGLSPLMAASENRYYSVVQRLLQAGADPRLKHHRTEQTALDVAIKNDYLEIIDILCKATT